ncbi:solvent efflux RND transporter outer membrane subunit SrpC [Pseudomonas sp. GD03817]|jgi:multidrug efflux system outer membrane protein|uniref:solvent efflux RND transporter outer membrane subunit SrpC n=1 Tax=Pseudomonas TaxID=286 RepID=UPI0015713F24|nr:MULTISPECIES: solvent efflux RND transporter outer membrane subunit SrpC [Pseudomonas]MCE0992408.1 solvent efflux RND transporter outer membrane subunit SrpC [Pseudomonas alloputida]MDH1402472.1 solvent efflux RND transporter outer membrane subunit SrpC [Pseudomonas sp. GD03730]MDH1775531.1 solvent efflux RND transporter outer membrane subunit SrpC [Pseudomonas sp. GD03817]QKL08736.1 solvent efflux RND transporter outer membrane subunit SrpC [Pseudomonas putida]WNI06931.1 solvent efflux RND
MKFKSLPVFALLMLSGCSLMPDYQQPAAPVQAQWPTGEAYGGQGDQRSIAAALPEAKNFFKDPALVRLLNAALENNRDLRIAAKNVESYRALYRIQRAERFPTLDGEASGNRTRLPDDLSPTGDSRIDSQYQVGLVTAYELDLFGRIRSLSSQALEKYLATEEAQRSVQIALIGDVATTYFLWRTDQALLELTEATLTSYVESLAMIESSAAAGTSSELDVRQARTLVNQAQAQQALYTRRIAQDVNALQLLLGCKIPTDLPQNLPLAMSAIGKVPAGLPADLLLNRPDIRSAEHQLIAANANIGAARAAFFPRISLTASAGSASSDLDGLFNGGSESWSFAPQISVPIFNAGKLRANLDYAEIQKDVGVATYEKSIQTAFREVADGLAARGTYGKQLRAQNELVDNYKSYFGLAQQRYDQGIDSYLTVLDAQRELFASQQKLLNDQLDQINSEVQLYKALGGGWSVSQN